MLTNAEIQAALISYAKGRANIVAALAAGATEIREDQWQGTQFTYPNIRLRLISNVPTGEAKECTLARVRLSWLVFGETDNSLETDQIAGIIYNELHRKMFTTGGIQFSTRTIDLIPAVRINNVTWKSELLMEATVQG